MLCRGASMVLNAQLLPNSHPLGLLKRQETFWIVWTVSCCHVSAHSFQPWERKGHLQRTESWWSTDCWKQQVVEPSGASLPTLGLKRRTPWRAPCTAVYILGGCMGDPRPSPVSETYIERVDYLLICFILILSHSMNIHSWNMDVWLIFLSEINK